MGLSPLARPLSLKISRWKKLIVHAAKAGAEKHCYECGQQCHKCQQLTQRACLACRGQYCREHDSGCNAINVRAA